MDFWLICCKDIELFQYDIFFQISNKKVTYWESSIFAMNSSNKKSFKLIFRKEIWASICWVIHWIRYNIQKVSNIINSSNFLGRKAKKWNFHNFPNTPSNSRCLLANESLKPFPKTFWWIFDQLICCKDIEILQYPLIF